MVVPGRSSRCATTSYFEDKDWTELVEKATSSFISSAATTEPFYSSYLHLICLIMSNMIISGGDHVCVPVVWLQNLATMGTCDYYVLSMWCAVDKVQALNYWVYNRSYMLLSKLQWTSHRTVSSGLNCSTSCVNDCIWHNAISTSPVMVCFLFLDTPMKWTLFLPLYL